MPPYICPYCGRVLGDATALLSHMKRFERGDKCILGHHGSPETHPFPCPECELRFTSKRGLSVHLTKTHARAHTMRPQIYQKYDIFMDLKNEIKQDEQHLQSYKEILLRCNGDLGKLTDKQIVILKTGGIIMPNQLSLTTKGLTMFLEVLKSENNNN